MNFYGMVKGLNNEGVTDSFWIANGTIKIGNLVDSNLLQ